MRYLILAVVSLVAVAGCKEVDPAYCPVHQGLEGCPPGGPCRNSDDCMDKVNFPICDLTENGGACVLCTPMDHAACTGVTPICSDNHTCVACVNDGDCGTGGLCLPNGACAAAESIIHASVFGGASPSSCGSSSAPCLLSVALAAVDGTRNVIKLDEQGPYAPSGPPNYIVTGNVTIDARGATIHKTVNGSILTISDGTTATILGGKLDGATDGDGILCGSNATLTVDGTTVEMNDKSGINAPSGCKLTVTNTTIRGNSRKAGLYVAGIVSNGDPVMISRSQFLSNKGGGINVSGGTFEIVGNIFYDNGDFNSSIGGVSITSGPAPTSRIEFNSLSGNHTATGNAPGVLCSAGAGTIARNNIIWGNNDSVGAQIGGSCTHIYSDIQSLNLVTSIDGGNNLNVDPMFKSASDLHVMPSSVILKKSDPGANLTGIVAKDIDGEPRIAPADIGADQLPRP